MFSTRRRFLPLLPALALLAGSAPALGWGAHGHRTVTLLALDRLPEGSPDWLRQADIRARISDQSNEPDRWRGTRLVPIGHEANPEHYIDVEMLAPFGLTLRGLPRHRYEALRAMALAKAAAPGAFAPVEPAKDRDKTKEWPGFLPWAIQEHTAKLQSSFHTYRILAAINDPGRALQLEQARQNIIYEMGVLSHFVGDAAQPLHTTIHHHGWIGENPQGYTTEYGIHSYIDSGIVALHALDYESLKPSMPAQLPAGPDAWTIGLEEIERSFVQVKPLYRMQKDGLLEQETGRTFIAERLTDAAATLGALYSLAWKASEPTDRDIGAFLKFSESGVQRAAGEGEPAAQPASEMEAKPKEPAAVPGP